jgi:hypothetical protein
MLDDMLSNASDHDSFYDEHHQFQWDIHILIEGTLDASIRYLTSEAETELKKIEEAMKKPCDDEYQEHLVDEHVEVLVTGSNQENFLRNMALVALASRLTHALRNMAKTAETFSPRKKRYGMKHMSEFNRLWVEYHERFGIDFEANKDRIAFVKTMQEVRNQIVHDGGEANTLKPLDEMDWSNGDAGLLDMSFSQKHPEYVSGSGLGAEVRVSEEQLQQAVKDSIELVGWLSTTLRSKELESLRESGRAK